MRYIKPAISVIIPTINREKFLLNTIKDLSKQKISNYEIIIIDQNNKINLFFYKNLKNKFRNISIKLFSQSMSNSSAARNFGVNKSKSDLILFLDDDVKINNVNFLKNHIKNFNLNDTHIVAGKIKEKTNNFNSKSIFFKLKLFFFKNDWRLFRLDSNFSCKKYKIGRSANLSVKKKSFLKLGGMDTNYIKGAHREETDFLFQASKKNIIVKFDPRSEIIHLKSNTGGIRNFSQYEKVFLELYGEIYFNLKHIFQNNIWLSFINIFRKYFFNKHIVFKPYRIIINLFILVNSFSYALIKYFFLKKQIFKYKKIF
jgi:glycosyltransferase involved in cell wall biosynthesis